MASRLSKFDLALKISRVRESRFSMFASLANFRAACLSLLVVVADFRPTVSESIAESMSAAKVGDMDRL